VSRLTLAVGVVALVAAFPMEARAEVIVDAGALRADVQRDPWRLTFTDGRGRVVLTESRGSRLSAGALGFRAAGVWRQATRVLSERRAGDAWVGELATSDPVRRLRVRIEPSRGGVISVRASVLGAAGDLDAYGVAFDARSGERMFGAGERSHAVDLRGHQIENYVSDGPYPAEERPVLKAFVPPQGFRERDDATYYPVPWLLLGRGAGVLVDNDETSYFRLAERDRWAIEVTNAPPGMPGALGSAPPARLDLRVFGGPRPRDALRRLTAATGRQPRPAAPWILGPWVQPSGDELVQLRKLRDADAPLSVSQTYLHYLPCGDQVGRRDAERRRTSAMHRLGVAVSTYLNPMLCTEYEPNYSRAAAAGAFTRTRTGEPYVYRYSTASQFLVAQFDFFRRSGRQAFAEVASEAVEDGYDGWMEDFGEYTPLDSISGEGIEGVRAHNRYPDAYHCAAHRFALAQPRPLLRFQRSGWRGSARCASVVWGGDPTTDWGFDGLRSAVRQALSMGLSGVSTWGSDIGGFFALGTRRLTPELLKRWVQFGAVSGVMRTQAEGIAVPPKERPQVWDDDQLDNWRRYAKLRTQLYPYLVAADARYRRSGLPIMAHLALEWPADRRASGRDDQFMFGRDLLAAPVLEPGARSRRLYLPRGHWIDLWRAVRYEPRSGGLELRRARVTAGGRAVGVPAPLRELPLLVRAGSVLPLLPPDVETLADYGTGLVRLADRRNRMELLAFPRGTRTSRFNEEERLHSAEGRRGWTLRVRGARTRTYRLQASLATLRRPFVPCAVRLDGRALPAGAWSYDRQTRRLRVAFRAREATVRVAACPAARSGPRFTG
jgi:sulfoquinovosidase